MKDGVAAGGLHRDLTVRRQQLVIQPLGHDVTAAGGGTVHQLVTRQATEAPGHRGIVARSMARPATAPKITPTTDSVTQDPATPEVGSVDRAAVPPRRAIDSDATPPASGSPSRSGQPLRSNSETRPVVANRAQDAVISRPATPTRRPDADPAAPRTPRIGDSGSVGSVHRKAPALEPQTDRKAVAESHGTPPSTHLDAIQSVTETASDPAAQASDDPSPASTAELPVARSTDTDTSGEGVDRSPAPIAAAPSPTRAPTIGLRPPIRSADPPVGQVARATQPTHQDIPVRSTTPRSAEPAGASPIPQTAQPLGLQPAEAGSSLEGDANVAVDRSESSVGPADSAQPGNIDAPQLGNEPSNSVLTPHEGQGSSDAPTDDGSGAASLQPTEPPSLNSMPLQRVASVPVDKKSGPSAESAPARPPAQPVAAKEEIAESIEVDRAASQGAVPPSPPPVAPLAQLPVSRAAALRPGPSRLDRAAPVGLGVPTSRPVAPANAAEDGPAVDRAAGSSSHRAASPSDTTPIGEASASAAPGPSKAQVPGDGLAALLQRAAATPDNVSPIFTDAFAGESSAASEVQVDRAPSGSAPSAASAPDSAEFVDEIYERIERRLRTELFDDLERRGHLSEWG
jgi:hypothetical protein